jgi:hypothetical protein
MKKANKLGYKATLRRDIPLNHLGEFILNADGSFSAFPMMEYTNHAGEW